MDVKMKTLISTTVIFFLGRSLYSPLIMRLHRGSYGRHGGCLLGRRHGDRLGPAEIPTTPPPPSPQRYHSTPWGKEAGGAPEEGGGGRVQGP